MQVTFKKSKQEELQFEWDRTDLNPDPYEHSQVLRSFTVADDYLDRFLMLRNRSIWLVAVEPKTFTVERLLWRRPVDETQQISSSLMIRAVGKEQVRECVLQLKLGNRVLFIRSSNGEELL